MKFLVTLLLTFALLAGGPLRQRSAPAPAGRAARSAAAPIKTQEWNLVTDQLHANLATGTFSAPDPVTMTRADGSVVKANRATGNYKQHKAMLFGNVSVHDASGTFGLKSAQGAQTQSRGPATLTADELHLDDSSHVYDALGNVHYTQGETDATSQSAHLDDATHVLNLTGKVHVVQGDRTLDADAATYNTQTGSGEADNNVTVTFPGITPSIATPKPIKIKAPKIP